MNFLSLSQVSKTYDLKPVLNNITLAVDSGERVGVIGANGSGKTTLFHIIAGTFPPDQGTVSLRKGISLGHLAQDPQLNPAATVHEVIASSLTEIQQVIAAYESLTERIASCQNEVELQQLHTEHTQTEHRLEQLGGWNYQHRIDTILGHLGIEDDRKLIADLSGGERKRVALACTFIQNPDFLVLDEPTNHLDAQTITWLEGYLDSYDGALLLITHDRYFLDNIVDRMVELADGKATVYKGGYSDYLVARAEREEIEARSHASLLNLLRREEAWLRRGVRARGTKSKHRVRSVLELREQARREAEQQLKAQITTHQRLGNTILEMSKLTIEFSGMALCKDLDFIMTKGDRVGLVGPNGCGKTTLLKTLMGLQEPTAGQVVRGKNTQFAYFAQDRLDLDPEQTVWEYISDNSEMVKVRDEFRTVRSYLKDFKFGNEYLHSKIKTLSGGEKNRLVLAKLLLTDANLLVLDEPTNDLDIETLQWIEDMLCQFPGCVLFVTHDRFFLDKVATNLLVFEGKGNVMPHAGNYSLYLQLEALAKEEAKAEREPIKPTPQSRKETTRKGLSFKEQQELTSIETQLADLEAQRNELEKQLSDPVASGLSDDYQRMTEVAHQMEELGPQINQLYERWLELEEKRQTT